MKMSYVSVFTVQPATGPNLKGNKLEVMEGSGVRLAYCDTEDEAADHILDAMDPVGVWEGTVIREDRGDS